MPMDQERVNTKRTESTVLDEEVNKTSVKSTNLGKESTKTVKESTFSVMKVNDYSILNNN